MNILKQRLLLHFLAIFVTFAFKASIAHDDHENAIYRFLNSQGDSQVSIPPQLAAALLTNPNIKMSGESPAVQLNTTLSLGSDKDLDLELRFTKEPDSPNENFSFRLQIKYWDNGKPKDTADSKRYPKRVMNFSGDAMYRVSPQIFNASYLSTYWLDHIPLKHLSSEDTTLSRLYLRPYSGREIERLRSKNQNFVWYEKVPDLSPLQLECRKPYEHIVDAFRKLGSTIQYGQLLCGNATTGQMKRKRHYSFAEMEFDESFKSVRTIRLCEATDYAHTTDNDLITLQDLPSASTDSEAKGPCYTKWELSFQKSQWDYQEIKEKSFSFPNGVAPFLNK